MSSTRKNRCRMTSTTTGTGTITLGSVVTGYTNFSLHGDGNTVPRFCIEGRNADESLNGQWEIGSGVYTASGTTLSRASREASSTGSAVSFSADHLVVYETFSALDAGNATPGGSDTQLQFNNAGALAGSDHLIFDGNGLYFYDTYPTHITMSITSSDGMVQIAPFGASVLRIDTVNTKIVFFGTSVVSQQTANQALTDSTGGTPSTTLVDVTSLGLADPAKVNANIASLASRLAEIRTLLINYGLGS